MLVIIYTALVSYMVYFALCIAPVINNTLKRESSSKLLRKVFPRNFLYGLTLTSIALLISLIENNIIGSLVSFIILISFLINLKILLPKINHEADLTTKKNEYTKKFKKLHFYSVFLYLINMILAIGAILFLK